VNASSRDAFTTGGEFPPEWTHPAERPVEPEHPMALMAEPCAGDPEIMLECVVQEYARLGLGVEEILGLCRDPFFGATHSLRELFGDAALERRVREIVGRCGVLRFSVRVSRAPAAEEEAAAGPCGGFPDDPFAQEPQLLCDEPAPSACGVCELAALCAAPAAAIANGKKGNHHA
jgi:hypothetical protein